MNNALIIVCCISHVLGDYYLQTYEMSKEKDEKFSALIIHSLIYSIPFIVFYFLNTAFNNYIVFTLVILIHFIIDTLKFLIIKQRKFTINSSLLYILDQFIHICTILLLCYIYKPLPYTPYSFIQHILEFIQVDVFNFSKWILLILLIYKPTNITFVKLFSSYKPVPDTSLQSTNTPQYIDLSPSSATIDVITTTTSQVTATDEDNIIIPAYTTSTSEGVGTTSSQSNYDSSKQAGKIIGFLERLTFIMCICISQYSAIGLVLTAKSVARYDKISKDQEFAEYYLIGTLFSVLCSIIIYNIVF